MEMARSRFTPKGFDMAFHADVVEVPIDRESLYPLVNQVKELYETETIPLEVSGCKECAKLSALVKIL